MFLRTTLHRGLSLLVICSLLLALLPAPALAQEPGIEPAPDETQRNTSYLPLVGGNATPPPAAPPPAAPPVTSPEPVTPVPYGDDGKWPAQLAGATGAVRPSLHGPQRNDPAEGIPAHAYSPFDERNNREYPCPPGGCNVMPGQLLLKLAPGVPTQRAGGALRTTDAALNATLDELGLATLEPVFPTARAPRAGEMITTVDGDPMPKPDLTRWVLATAADPDTDLAAAVTTLRAAPRITWAEPVYLREPVGETPNAERGVGNANSEPRPSGRAALTPAAALTFDDPLFGQQWHLAATNVPQAWEWLASQGLPPGGNRDIVVAVIDTGVDYTHPDLAANIWTNSGEIAGDGLDNDSNGYTDDVHGADTVAGDDDPQDDHGHGTHVAGIIAAQANNGVGGVGVAYNVQIMPLKAAQYSGVLASSDIAEAIFYAVEKGADVINMSFGGYARSQVEEDALATAFGQAVLVAAAGNDGKVNLPCSFGRDMYPAAYNWVLGVMARTPTPDAQGDYLAGFSNFDCSLQDSHEYELMAPGVGIWSSLPNGQQAAWAGTSMATPVVAGIAALARTKWANKDVYSSRFIMGQIATTGGLMQAYTPPQGAPVSYYTPNALLALTTVPQPKLSYLEHWTFDTAAQAVGNDSDGIVDAGETVDLAIVIRNHWGKADNVQVTLAAQAGVVGPDPYVTMITSTVNYGAVGSFNIDDNGLLYDAQGAITGVRNPFQFTVDPNTPNDHVIPFKLTMVADNGYDPAAAPLTFESSFILVVQRGRELPRIISQDMTLTKENLWIVPDATLIEEGIRLTVTEGTQIQFYETASDEPYIQDGKPKIQVEGTLEVWGTVNQPVELYTDLSHLAFPIEITQVGTGQTYLRYVRATNPVLGIDRDVFTGMSGLQPLTLVEHAYFTQEVIDCIIHPIWRYCALDPVVKADNIRLSIFRGLGPLLLESPISTSLMDASTIFVQALSSISNNVFLRNFRLLNPMWGQNAVSQANGVGYILYEPAFMRTIFPVQYNGKTYVAIARQITDGSRDRVDLLSLEVAEEFANKLGGHVVAITDQAENDFLSQYGNAFSMNAFVQTYPEMDCGIPDHSGPGSGCWSLFLRGDFIIGLTDSDGDGQFTWISGEPFQFSSWATAEPNRARCPTCNGNWVQKQWDGWHYVHWFNGPLVLELPGVAMGRNASILDDHNRIEFLVIDNAVNSQDEQIESVVEATRQEMIAEGPSVGFRNNAILNVWWDPNVDHWMRFKMDQGRGYVRFLTNNFWGTTSTSLIDAAIQDYNDDFNKGEYRYLPIQSTAPTTTYPFAVDVTLSPSIQTNTSTLNGPTPKVSAEPITFTVTFNRDMDPTVQPAVSFGPDVPMTDYTIHPIDGGWADARTWQGTFNITPVTGDGYQLIRVAGARAADDPWLVTGDDAGRFRFEIITSGTESMNLQANGGEGFVDLSWMQDDFDLLAGFNLYRATSENGSYTRVNHGIIPPQQRAFRDTNVTPGVPYFYKFTVVKSDMSESDFSNVATAAPVDTIAPVISHTPVLQAAPGQSRTFAADVTDNVGVQSVTLFHRKTGATTYASRAMVKTTSNRYNATLEGSLLASPGIEYYIEAGDGVSTARAGRADLPFVVAVVDRPVVTTVAPNQGPAAGGTTVTVRGSNFKVGATVAFGGIAATGVTVLSSSEITCVTGAHFPEVVDVRVTNPDGQFGQLLRGFTYVADTASVGLPDVSGGQQELVTIPINAANVAGLAAAELTLTFDPAVLRATGVRTGSLTPGWSLTANTSTPGQVRLALISPGATAAGAGVLANIDFEVLAAAGVTTTLHLADLLLNDGAIPAQSADGTFTVAQVYAVSGTILTWKDSAPVPNVNLTLTGDRVYTAASTATGVFTVTGVHRDSYTLVAEKADDVNGISAYDAALALMHTVGASTLTGHAFTAGDVNRNGSVSAMDAFYILQKSVDLITLPFPGAGVVWQFAPTSRTYSDLAGDQTNQDFTAVLLGDISGNWSTPVTVRTGSAANDSPTVSLGSAAPITATILLPLFLDTAGGQVYSLELVIAYTGSGTPLTPELTTATADWMISSNLSEPGVIRIAMAGTSPVAGSAAVLQLPFVPGAGPDNLVVTITAARADEQEIEILPVQNQPALYLPLVHGR